MAESPNGAYAADESLVGPMAKLERRAGLIDKLLREIEAWEQARPYTARWSSDDVSSSLSVIVDIDTAPPAQEWGLRFGDAVHNLRSALDHAVYGFAIDGAGVNPPPGAKKLSFPILDEEARWADTDPRLRSVAPDVVQAIRNAQPFHQAVPAHDWLWVLAELDNIDKHRLIHPVAMTGTSLVAEIESMEGGETTTTAHPFSLSHGGEVLTIESAGAFRPVGQPQVDIVVAVNVYGLRTPREVLVGVFHRVDGVLGSFYAAD
jgi:hypothetical protein